jgi:hypothetical protein
MLVVLSGAKARLLAGELRQSGRKVVEVPHVGNKGLNVSYTPSPWASSPGERRARRVEMWAGDVLEAVPATAERS